ncbi:hypothetical protein M407DRAFT_19014 [Tulasnella calospora MUT 4182]|uniref:F-box domain-containing protein n=1 Tax=Tulasnella calospora MUT 4182 TaxID=1051891 RepID=A0A0C3LDI0_9AGAM|nr:hypothetical protein M407DRAFT_19014 [Tulasnella calospora MUT 4182]
MTLLNLPKDVLIETCNYLDTRTLWKLMASCKPIHKLMECRAIWINQLKQLSSEYGIVGGTYDFYSMATPEIRKAAIRPYRFERAVQFEEINPIHYRTTIENEFVQLSKLAPGGRWLVTLSVPRSERGPSFCRVWDLQSKAQVSEPYASLPIEQQYFGHHLVLRPDSNGKTFQVIFAPRPPNQEALWRVYILQFDHLNEAGERLRKMHTFEASGHSSLIQLIGNYIISGSSVVCAS